MMRQSFQTLERSHVIATRGLICTSHPLASYAGSRALMQGGSAIDAALTALIVQGVVDPAMTGIGGDCFCLIAHDQDKDSVQALNGSGKSPKAAHLDHLGGKGIAMTDPAAITIPGALHAWAALHESYGKLPWSDLFIDAIHYASKGFAVHERVAHDWAKAASQLANSPSAAPAYLKPDLSAPKAGDIWRLPKLAKTLKTIAQDGPGVFYEGALARAMVDHCQNLGGQHCLDDFKTHQSDWTTPLSISYGDTRIYECPPNTQGLVALIAFAILDHARERGLLTAKEPFNPDRVEWQLRALSSGYQVRDSLIADLDLCQELAQACLSPEFIAKLTKEIAHQIQQKIALYTQPFSTPHKDTVYVAARDSEGLSVSIINSLFNAFGSTHVAGDTGILLHSRGMSFTHTAEMPNAYGPAKRPMHTIIPALALKNGRVDTIFGVMGAHFQPQGHVHVYTAMKDCNLSPQAAQNLPRWFANPEGYVEIEQTAPDDLVRSLRKRLGNVVVTSEPLGGSQIIQIRDGVMIGGTDPRKDGIAIGF